MCSILTAGYRWIPFVFAAIALLNGCGRSSPVQANNRQVAKSNSTNKTHDFGDIDLDDGSRVLTHTFDVINSSAIAKKIDRVISSCGCTVGKIDHRVLSPGESTPLDATLTLGMSGNRTQTLTVVFDDKSLEPFTLSAKGITTIELFCFGVGFEESGRQFVANLYLIDYKGDGETGDTRLFCPEGVRGTFKGWETLERRSGNRPARQIGEIVFERDQDRFELPANIVIRTKKNRELKFRVPAYVEK